MDNQQNLYIFFQHYFSLENKYNYPLYLKLRLLSKNINIDELLPNNLRKKLKLYNKYKEKKKKICTGCLKISYHANHYGYCVKCRYQYIPEISSTNARRKLGISSQYLDLVPYRYSHPPIRKVFRSSYLWEIMKLQCSESSRNTKCCTIVKGGLNSFYKLVNEIAIK